jgi:hypothetical protein
MVDTFDRLMTSSKGGDALLLDLGYVGKVCPSVVSQVSRPNHVFPSKARKWQLAVSRPFTRFRGLTRASYFDAITRY